MAVVERISVIGKLDYRLKLAVNILNIIKTFKKHGRLYFDR